MIQLFDIKRKNKKMKNEDKELLEKYCKISSKDKKKILEDFKASKLGLKENEADKRLESDGLNTVVKNKKRTWLYFFIKSFEDKFIFILFALAIINFLISDKLGSFIILGIAFVSALIRFFQDYSVYKFNQNLKAQIYTTTTVLRNNKEEEIKVENVVKGDIIKLNAGEIIPADIFLLESKDLFINQSVFTGESIPVEKVTEYNETGEIFSISNICLMGSSVVSGSATGIVIETGFNTYLGRIGQKLDTKKELTNFEIGMENITKLLIRYMIIVSVAVFIIYGILRQDVVGAILFALSVAVGITPSMLPMIVNVNLTKGSKSLAKKDTLVKNIKSIQDLGAIDVLCTDKTGTLTEDKIVLQKYIDATGKENQSILEYAYLNSYYGTGMKNLVDRAIITYGNEHNIKEKIETYEKIDEIPFDYIRKRMSIAVKHNEHYRMITKGALEEVLKCCNTVKINEEHIEITEEHIENIEKKAKELARTGMQVIALASKREYPGKEEFNEKFEANMTFIGFVAFLDPPKKDVKETLSKLKKAGVTTKIITGDNPFATETICNLVGIKNEKILLGTDIEKMSDKEVYKVVEEVNVFARMNPLEKERIITACKHNGHVVGYMGDGVNDAPSLHSADVGICVNTATDIAKEASDIILLKKNLDVIYNGVMEGRKVYGNIIKYMKMALSADFGDVFSILIASIFLPFLPLLPIQMLIQDFLYDISQIAIPYDDVDKEFLEKPKKWNTKGLGNFMNVMGITSSVIDVIAFIIFWFILGYNSVDNQAYFQTAWFVECLISETLIIHFVRTAKVPFIQSRANKFLTGLTAVTIIGTIITPLLLHNIPAFNFVILPPIYYVYVIGLTILYAVLVEFIKKIYIRKYGEWL